MSEAHLPIGTALRALLIAALLGVAAPAEAAPRRIELTERFVITSSAKSLRFAARLGKIADADLWDKLESGVTKPILYRIQLINARGDAVAEFFRRLSVRYDPLAQEPFFEVKRARAKKLLVVKTRRELLALLTDMPHPYSSQMPRQEEFPESLLAELEGGSYRLRILIWINPWTEEQLAQLNKLFRPLGTLNLLRVRLFDNSKFRPQREFEVTSQPFYLYARSKHGTL